MGNIDKRLAELGIDVPTPAAPVANYVGWVRTGNRVFTAGQVPLKDGEMKDVTFHDPCYLGRYNDEYDAPRATLKAVKGLRIIEMDRTKERGLCCGAGGGHFWMDLKR